MNKFHRSIFAAVSASLLLWAMPVWAGHSLHFGNGHHTSGKHLSKSGGSGKEPVLTIDSDDSAGADTDASAHPSSNKGGAIRGLERANEVAGEHSETGRANAADHGHH